jgi:hypothetical protein
MSKFDLDAELGQQLTLGFDLDDELGVLQKFDTSQSSDE